MPRGFCSKHFLLQLKACEWVYSCLTFFQCRTKPSFLSARGSAIKGQLGFTWTPSALSSKVPVATHLHWALILSGNAPGSAFPGGTSGKEPICQCRRHRDSGLIPGFGRSPGGGHSNPLQYSCLENPMDRGVWQATVHRVSKNQTQLKQLSTQSWFFF